MSGPALRRFGMGEGRLSCTVRLRAPGSRTASRSGGPRRGVAPSHSRTPAGARRTAATRHHGQLRMRHARRGCWCMCLTRPRASSCAQSCAGIDSAATRRSPRATVVAPSVHRRRSPGLACDTARRVPRSGRLGTLGDVSAHVGLGGHSPTGEGRVPLDEAMRLRDVSHRTVHHRRSPCVRPSSYGPGKSNASGHTALLHLHDLTTRRPASRRATGNRTRPGPRGTPLSRPCDTATCPPVPPDFVESTRRSVITSAGHGVRVPAVRLSDRRPCDPRTTPGGTAPSSTVHRRGRMDPARLPRGDSDTVCAATPHVPGAGQYRRRATTAASGLGTNTLTLRVSLLLLPHPQAHVLPWA